MNSSMDYSDQKNGNNFLDQKNEAMINRLVYSDFMRRTNGNINDKQKDRLIRTVHHYMNEVYSTNPRGNVQNMNTEVLKAVVADYNTYLNRGAISATSDTDTRMKEDIGSRFTALQNERTEQKVLMPSVPDFRVPIEDSNDLPALTLFEQAKKQRETQAKRELENTKRDDSFSGTFLKDLIQESQGSGLAIANPTIVKPETIRIRPALSQDVIIPQDDILSYKENEYNLVIYSADRDWYNNTRENRYNFSVTFNPANNSQGFKYSPSANMRFHNIVRIEMVKALVPNESVNTLITNTGTGAAPTYGTSTNLNVLTEPGIIIRVDELESNVFGTDNQLDRAFATLQYDAQWVSDATTSNPGYLAMIPKFLKCQKTYYPTPLATLTKLTIQLQRPNGNLVNDALDTLDISGIFASTSFIPAYSSSSVYMNAALKDTNNNATFYTIVTKTYFSRFAFAKNDRINIQNINTALITGNDSAKSDFKSYMETNTGLLIVATGYTAGTVFTDGANSVGYCNFIVVQAQYRDPTTGSVLINPFGGTDSANQNLAGAIYNKNLAGSRLINLSKQTQLTFRVITRDMDSATRIRPNNA